jgi:hypothetical protein
VSDIVPESVYFILGTICPIVFMIILIRNIVKRKSLVGWLFPGGTTKTERIVLFSCVFIFFLLLIFG